MSKSPSIILGDRPYLSQGFTFGAPVTLTPAANNPAAPKSFQNSSASLSEAFPTMHLCFQTQSALPALPEEFFNISFNRDNGLRVKALQTKLAPAIWTATITNLDYPENFFCRHHRISGDKLQRPIRGAILTGLILMVGRIGLSPQYEFQRSKTASHPKSPQTGLLSTWP